MQSKYCFCLFREGREPNADPRNYEFVKDMVSICKRPIEYASKLTTFLQDDMKILAMLAQVKPLLEQSTCFGKLNSAMYSQGGRRRLKKYEENERDIFGLDRPKATWGFNIGINNKTHAQPCF